MTKTPSRPPGFRIAALGGGAVFAASLIYFAASYAGRFGVPADAGAGLARPLLIDVLLIAAFAAHHSAFARSGLKARIHAVAPPDVERTVYVWIASLLFFAMTWWWQPVPGVLWHLEPPFAWLLRGLQVAGVAIAFAAGRQIDVLDLAGVREALGRPARPAVTVFDRGPYGVVRHPLYLAWLLLVWPMPTMTGTRVVLAVLSTIYVLIAIPLEERDLFRSLGPKYRDYMQRVRARVVPGIY